MEEIVKKKTGLELYRERQRALKLAKQSESAQVSNIEQKVEEVKVSHETIADVQPDGSVVCHRCSNVFLEKNAVVRKEFQRLGCPKCGFPIK